MIVPGDTPRAHRGTMRQKLAIFPDEEFTVAPLPGHCDTTPVKHVPSAHLDESAGERILASLTFGQPLERAQRTFALAWIDGLLRSAERDQPKPAELAQRIDAEVRVDPVITDRLTCQLHDALRMAEVECARAFGRLCGTYYLERRSADELFASLTSMLSQCHLGELVGVRELMGHCACIAPHPVSDSLLLETGFISSYQAWMHSLARCYDSEAPAHVPGATWPAHVAWRRLYYLLVSSGLAGSRGYSKIGLQHVTVMQIQHFLSPKPIAQAHYTYRLRGGTGAVTAELVSSLPCFGFGSTPEAALATLRSNLMLFVKDAASAELVEHT